MSRFKIYFDCLLRIVGVKRETKSPFSVLRHTPTLGPLVSNPPVKFSRDIDTELRRVHSRGERERAARERDDGEQPFSTASDVSPELEC